MKTAKKIFFLNRFCVGDRFFLSDNKILCEYDYEERMVFANLVRQMSDLRETLYLQTD